MLDAFHAVDVGISSTVGKRSQVNGKVRFVIIFIFHIVLIFAIVKKEAIRSTLHKQDHSVFTFVKLKNKRNIELMFHN